MQVNFEASLSNTLSFVDCANNILSLLLMQKKIEQHLCRLMESTLYISLSFVVELVCTFEAYMRCIMFDIQNSKEEFLIHKKNQL